MLTPAGMKFGLCMVYAASQNVYDHAVPFGGYKDSGIGRDKGEYALHHYTQVGRAREERVAAGIASRLPHDVHGIAQHPLSHSSNPSLGTVADICPLSRQFGRCQRSKKGSTGSCVDVPSH